MLEISFIEDQIYFWGFLYLCIELTGIYFAVQAILKARTSQAAIAWSISLISLPLLVLPLYWVFGSSRFYAYMNRMRMARMENIDNVEALYQQIKPYYVHNMRGIEDIIHTTHKLETLPFTSHNGVKLLINGEKTYKEMLKAIESARDYVLLQFYIVNHDSVGEAFRQLLTKKLKQGVRVYFLYDKVGSHALSSWYLHKLRKAGAHVASFDGHHNGIGKYLHINFRNHRKILIVDGLKAFVGGLNLGDEYLGKNKTMGYWRDTHVLLRGPSVQVMQAVFIKDWYWSRGHISKLNWQIQAAETHRDKMTAGNKMQAAEQEITTYTKNVMILDTGPADEKPVCSLFLCALINSSKKRLWITSPYFVPDAEVINALKNAALRNVDVRLILPEKYDKFFVYLTSFAYYKELKGYDIKIYRYTKGFSHQKVILVDDQLSGIGTVNLDNRSIHLNFEIMAYIADKEFNAQVSDMLEYDMNNCYLDNIEDFEQRPFWFKAISRVFYLFSPVL